MLFIATSSVYILEDIPRHYSEHEQAVTALPPLPTDLERYLVGELLDRLVVYLRNWLHRLLIYTQGGAAQSRTLCVAWNFEYMLSLSAERLGQQSLTVHPTWLVVEVSEVCLSIFLHHVSFRVVKSLPLHL